MAEHKLCYVPASTAPDATHDTVGSVSRVSSLFADTAPELDDEPSDADLQMVSGDELESRLDSHLSLAGLRVQKLSPLMYSLVAYDLDLAERILSEGVGVELDWQTPDGGYSCLHFAAENRMNDVVALLLKAKANSAVCTLDKVIYGGVYQCGGQTPLHLAASVDNAEGVRLLLDSGANGWAKDWCHNTPVMRAALAKKSRCVELLSSLGYPLPHEAADTEGFVREKLAADTAAIARRLAQDIDRLRARVHLYLAHHGRQRSDAAPSLSTRSTAASGPGSSSAVNTQPGSDVLAARGDAPLSIGASVTGTARRGSQSAPKDHRGIAGVMGAEEEDSKLQFYATKGISIRPRVVIVPGAKCAPVVTTNWYRWLAKEIARTLNIEVVLPLGDMPEPLLCREKVWVPHIMHTMGVDQSTILIGHSTGGDAVLRALESTPALGAILVACGRSIADAQQDQDQSVAAARERNEFGYHNRPWQWDRIRAHAKFIGHFHSKDDEVISVDEGRSIHRALGTDFLELDGRGHFTDKRLPEVLEAVQRHIKAQCS